MNAYTRLRKHYRPRKDNPWWVTLIGIVVFGWIGVGLGLLLLPFLRKLL
jgi:hypothetical protein